MKPLACVVLTGFAILSSTCAGCAQVWHKYAGYDGHLLYFEQCSRSAIGGSGFAIDDVLVLDPTCLTWSFLDKKAFDEKHVPYPPPESFSRDPTHPLAVGRHVYYCARRGGSPSEDLWLARKADVPGAAVEWLADLGPESRSRLFQSWGCLLSVRGKVLVPMPRTMLSYSVQDGRTEAIPLPDRKGLQRFLYYSFVLPLH